MPKATCSVCSRPVMSGQRYCLGCGHRLADHVVPWRAAAPAPEPLRHGVAVPVRRRVPRPKTAAALVLAALGTGTLLGAAATPAPTAAGAIAAAPMIGYAPPPTATATPEPAATAAASLPDDVPAASTSPDPTPTPVATSPPAPSPTHAASTDTSGSNSADETPREEVAPAAKHVVIVSLTGHHFTPAFGAESPAAYLAQVLPAQGTLLARYHGVAGDATANALALMTGLAEPPDATASLPAELTDVGRTWKAYVQGAAAPCLPSPRDPFPALSLQDCATADVSLDVLEADFSDTDAAPSLAYVIPDGCHDGSDVACPQAADGTSGLARADAWLREWIPKITESNAFADDGLLVVLFDGDRPDADPARAAHVGAVVVSRFARKGSVSRRRYDHLSLLRMLTATFGVDPLGDADAERVQPFGRDVFPKHARDTL